MIFNLLVSIVNVTAVIIAVETNTFDGWSYFNFFLAVSFAFFAGAEQ